MHVCILSLSHPPLFLSLFFYLVDLNQFAIVTSFVQPQKLHGKQSRMGKFPLVTSSSLTHAYLIVPPSSLSLSFFLSLTLSLIYIYVYTCAHTRTIHTHAGFTHFTRNALTLYIHMYTRKLYIYTYTCRYIQIYLHIIVRNRAF